jgi:hypothetical protein
MKDFITLVFRCLTLLKSLPQNDEPFYFGFNANATIRLSFVNRALPISFV